MTERTFNLAFEMYLFSDSLYAGLPDMLAIAFLFEPRHTSTNPPVLF